MKRIETKWKQQQSSETTLKEVFRSESGAIDLASIMVGIIVIGLIGGVIAATVFAIIPWAQDNAAKQQLDSVVAAESAYMGLSSTNPPSLPSGLAGNSYGASSELETAGLLKTGPKYCASTMASSGKSYEAFSVSSSGKIWTATEKATKPVLYTGTLPTDCQFITGGVTTPAAPPAYVDPTPTVTSLTLKCDVNTTSVLFMQGNLTGTEKWNDRTATTYTNAATNTSRLLNANVTYTVTFTGTYTNFTRPSNEISACLRSVDHWGKDTGVTNASSALSNAVNLTSVPENIPSTITNMNQMFTGSSNFNSPNISKWDVSKVTNMANMFNGASKFNQPLNDWNVSSATNLSAMFWGATAFNQPLDKWNMSKATNLYGMFTNATSFNQELSSWDVSQVTSTNNMFAGATLFNKPLNSWNVSNVTDMGNMFQNSGFNQSLNSWNVSKVTNMFAMFNGNNSFNQDISMWNTAALTDGRFFVPAAFNNNYMPLKTSK